MPETRSAHDRSASLTRGSRFIAPATAFTGVEVAVRADTARPAPVTHESTEVPSSLDTDVVAPDVDDHPCPSRIVVLAAGLGSRLRRRGPDKPLVRLGGLSLLERSIIAANEAGFVEVVVVTGHQGERVARHALEVSRRRGVAVTVVHNDRYRESNGLSVLAARDAVGEEPFALVMADHVFAAAFMGRLRTSKLAPGQVVVAVDRSLGQAVGVDTADAMKVRLRDDQVQLIDKNLDHYDAFDVGAFVCGPSLVHALERASARGDTTLAGAVQIMADSGDAQVLSLVGDEWWFDVDTPGDHRRGRRFLLSNTGKALDGAVATKLNRAISQRVATPLVLRAAPRITPNQITLVAFAVAVAAAAAFMAAAPLVAAVLITLASVLDGSDGEVARLQHRTSPYGGFLDAVLDRVADGVVFTGVAIYLATRSDLIGLSGSTQAAVAIGVSGLALVGHLGVSYTTAKAAVDLNHRYQGPVIGGGHGRDLRLLILTLGAVAAAFSAAALLVSIGVIAVLCTWIIVVRLRASWWAEGPGNDYLTIGAVAFDFDGTLADTMGALTDLATALLTTDLGLDHDEATRRYRATAGDDFATQLDTIAPGHPRAESVAHQFESDKDAVVDNCRPFPDTRRALAQLSDANIPILICSSTRAELVHRFCGRHGLSDLVTTIDGWRPGRPKKDQLEDWTTSIGIASNEVLFVGDSLRDAAIAETVGLRFIGVARPDQPDGFAGTGLSTASSVAEIADRAVRAHRSPVSVGRPDSTEPITTPAPSPPAANAGEMANRVNT